MRSKLSCVRSSHDLHLHILEGTLPPALPSQIGYDECTEYGGKMRRRGRGQAGHPPSYAVVKKMKSLTLHTHGCLCASLRDWSSSSWFSGDEWVPPDAALHSCLRDEASELSHIRQVVEVFLALLAPKSYTRCSCTRHLLREIFTNKGLTSLAIKLFDYVINQLFDFVIN